MNDKRIFELRAEICKAMAHPLRMEIIDLLKDGPIRFGDIHEATGGLKSNLSQHLSVMTTKGILSMRKEGQTHYYSLVSERVTEACQLMKDMLVEQLKKEKELLDHLL